jgi:hypothetical protein
LSQKRQFFRKIFQQKYFKNHNIGPRPLPHNGFHIYIYTKTAQRTFSCPTDHSLLVMLGRDVPQAVRIKAELQIANVAPETAGRAAGSDLRLVTNRKSRPLPAGSRGLCLERLAEVGFEKQNLKVQISINTHGVWIPENN